MAFSDSNLLHGCACLCFRSENRAIAYGRASPRRTSMKQCSQTTTTRNPWPRSCPRMSNTITPRCCSPTTLKSFIRTRRRSTLMESRSRDVAFFHGERHMPHTHCTFSISCILHAAPAAQFKTACTRAMCCLPNKRPPCSLIRAMHFSCCRLNWRNTADRSVAQNFCNMPFFVRRMQSHSCAVLLLWPVAVAVLLAVATGSIQSSARWQHQQQYHHEHHHQRQRNRIVETVSEL